jgi:glycosyltransferase involved in cell wall biosynthesis
MPCFNSASFIREAIQSIIDQTYKEWELMVMDDCSTDHTVAMVEEILEREGRIILYKSDENKGVAYQMNKGISSARGEYICRMDSDDRSDPDRIREQLSFMDKSPEIDLCTTDYKLFYHHAPGVSQIKHGPRDNESIRIGLLKDLPLCGPSFFARKEIMRLFSFEETLVIAEDYDLFCRIAKEHKIANLGKPLYNYRKHGSSLTDNSANWKTEKIDLIRRRYLESTGIRLEEKQIAFFIDFITAKPGHRVNRLFFNDLSRLERTFLDNGFFDHRSIRTFFRDSLHHYLLATKDYGFFAFIYALGYYPSVLFRYSLKDGLRIIIRSLNA